MNKIISVQGVELLDSRGNPTVAAKVVTDSGAEAWAMVPSGASTGQNEALELRDEDAGRYRGKGVLKAIASLNGAISDLLVGESVFDQTRLDKLMIDADGTENKSRFGANAMLAASLASARAAAMARKEPLYAYLGGQMAKELPCPMLNIINGGVHADNTMDFQEFMIRPVGAPSFSEALRWGVEVYHVLRGILKKQKHVTSVGDEGGFAPNLSSHEEALELICEAIKQAGFVPGKEISLALDCAASELLVDGHYVEKKKPQGKKRSYKEQVAYLEGLVERFPIDSIEDGLAESDWEGWHYLTEKLGSKVQLVGDDIFVTNRRFLQKGIDTKCANSILIKVNQIGTLSETLDTIALAQANGFACIISHRSGETEDSFIADLAVACRAGQIKTGAPCRSDRVAKYNRLLQIAQELGPSQQYVDSNRFAST
ncbi:MAG: phosphopyruvate hydratase [Verrucomicrobia bacterium]|nr:phosphopyruvate hydratase [Verrucomicrobiota bacterium]MBS0636577.1 phosphopyruvate hydratase [Verrucomicrobiota bacterium]